MFFVKLTLKSGSYGCQNLVQDLVFISFQLTSGHWHLFEWRWTPNLASVGSIQIVQSAEKIEYPQKNYMVAHLLFDLPGVFFIAQQIKTATKSVILVWF